MLVSGRVMINSFSPAVSILGFHQHEPATSRWLRVHPAIMTPWVLRMVQCRAASFYGSAGAYIEIHKPERHSRNQGNSNPKWDFWDWNMICTTLSWSLSHILENNHKSYCCFLVEINPYAKNNETAPWYKIPTGSRLVYFNSGMKSYLSLL